MKRTLIFDFDGTLFDTSTANHLAYSKAIESLGLTIPDDLLTSISSGGNYRDFLSTITSDTKIIDCIHERKKELYPSFFNEIIANQNLIDLLIRSSSSFNIVLFTTASKKTTLMILEQFKIVDYFDLIIAQEDVQKLKPSSDGYLIIFKKLNVEASDCLVFEDSQRGVDSAISSGCDVCLINWNKKERKHG